MSIARDCEAALKCSIANQIDQARDASRCLEERADGTVGELHVAATFARDIEAMTDVLADVGQSERRELAAHGDSLIDLPHLRHLQVRL